MKLLELACSCNTPLRAFVEDIADTSDSTSVRCMERYEPFDRDVEVYGQGHVDYMAGKFERTGIYAGSDRDAHVFAIEGGEPVHDVYNPMGEIAKDGTHVPEEVVA